MAIDRRQFVGNSALATSALALSTSLPGLLQASTGSAGGNFNIHRALQNYLQDIGLDSSDSGGAITFTGEDPILHSHIRLGACMAVPGMACAVGAAAIWKDRTGEGQDTAIDLREAIWNLNPFYKFFMQGAIASGELSPTDPLIDTVQFIPTLNGRMMQAPFFVGNPVSFTIFESKDGKPVTATGLYHHHLDNFLKIIGTPPDSKAIGKAIKKWDAEDLEQACFERNAIFSIHRTVEEWSRHPQGQHLATVPLVEIEKVADTDPIPFPDGGDQPLSGIKVLSNTHVIAGTTVSRTLAEYGAEVLHLARPQSFEYEFFVTDVNVGMRSTWLNIKQEDERRQLDKLLSEADVFVQNVRGLDRHGFGPEQVAEKRPGSIYLSANCYGYGGPWAEHGGFDMEGCSVSGITMIEGNGGPPKYPPTLIVNDFLLGYIGASGVLAALRRRAKEGGTYHVKVSLTRAAMWYSSLGLFETTEFDGNHPDHRMIPPRTITGQTPYGEVHRLAPMVQMARTPSRWQDPIVHVRGASRPAWIS